MDAESRKQTARIVMDVVSNLAMVALGIYGLLLALRGEKFPGEE